MSFSFPIEALKDEVASVMSAAGIDVPHLFGESAVNVHGAAPRYVWVPTRSADKNETPTRSVQEYRTLFVTREHCEIHCWGATYAQAWALRQNVIKALHDAAGVDVQLEGASRWEGPGESWNQSGELYVLEVSLECPVVDAWVDVQTLPDVAPDTAEVDGLVLDEYQSPDLSTNGDLVTSVIIP